MPSAPVKKNVRIALLGLGTVGGGVVKILESHRAGLEERAGCGLTLAAIAVLVVGGLLVFDGPGIREVSDQDPALGLELHRRFIHVVVDRLQQTRLRMLEAYAE